MKRQMSKSIAFCGSLLALTSCGGGGGSSSQPASTTATNTTTSAAVPATFQAAGTTVTYAVDSASATIVSGVVTGTQLNAAGSGSTVTISTDSNGNLSSVVFNIATPSTRFTQAYTNTTALPVLNLGILASALAAVNATSGVNGFIGGGLTLSGLSYSTYGVWAQNSGTSGLIGTVDAGTQTTAAAMPHTGSATYNGQTLGAAASSTASYALTGNVQLTANFASGTTSTVISGLQYQNLSTNAVTSQTSLSGAGTITGNHYSGALSGGSLTGTSVGSFYGPSAQETAGAWRVAGGGLTAIGSYGAKQ